MSRDILALFLLLSLSTISFAASSGNELKRGCDNATGYGAGYCLGFVVGTIRGYAKATNLKKSGICIPNAVTNQQLESIVKLYMANNPNKLHESPELLILSATQEAFAC